MVVIRIESKLTASRLAARAAGGRLSGMARKSTRRASRYGNDGGDPTPAAPAAPAPTAGSYGNRSKTQWTKSKLAARKRSVRTRTGSNHRDPRNGRYT